MRMANCVIPLLIRSSSRIRRWGGFRGGGWSMLFVRVLEASRKMVCISQPIKIGRGALIIGQTSITPARTLDVSVARRAAITPSEMQQFGLVSGDILVSRVFATLAGVGLPAYVTQLPEPAVFESNMMRLRVNESVIRSQLLFEVLRTHEVRKQILGVATISNQASINQSGLTGIQIGIPPLAEQAVIIGVISELDKCIRAEESCRDQLHLLKRGLMQDLLTGRVRVSVAEEEDEPVHVHT